MKIAVKLDRRIYEESYQCDTIENALAFLGGFNAMLYVFIQFIIGGYQEFRFKKSIARTFYTASNHVPQLDKESHGDGSNKDFFKSLQARPQVTLRYFDSLVAKLVRYFCCCKRNTDWFKEKQKKLEAHDEAHRRINNEIDLLNILTLLRQCQFMSLTTLKDYQRKLIPSMYQYNIDDFANYKDEALDGPYYQTDLIESIEGFDPFGNKTDRLILD